MLRYAAILPHPPILIPSIGGSRISEIENTVKSLKIVSKDLTKLDLDSIIIISPHARTAYDYFPVYLSENFSGDFSQFGIYDVRMEARGDTELADLIIEEGSKGKLNVEGIKFSLLDHGVMVPLYYPWQENLDKPIVVCAVCFDRKYQYEYGKAVYNAILKSKKNVAFIASGDLSHRLTHDAPAGYDEAGQEFDNKLVNYLENNELSSIRTMDEELIERAGECGLRSINVLLGVISRLKLKPEVLSYEGPFGVGYLVARFQ